MSRITLRGAKLDDVAVRGFRVPSNWKFLLIPGGIGRLLAGLVWVRPEVRPRDCVGCGDCVSMCPAGAINLDSGTAVIDRARCTSCLCCHEACVAGAVDAKMSRLARLIA